MESASLENILPQTNKIASYKLSDKVKSLKNYVYYITCSSTNNDTSTSVSTNNNGESTSSNSLKVLSVKIQDNQTVITFSIKQHHQWKWINIDKNAYISANDQRYTLIKADGIAIAPGETYYFYAGETKIFKLYFPAIPQNTTSIDFIEAEYSSWKIYGIPITILSFY